MPHRENSWWNPGEELFSMAALLDPMRFPYFLRILTRTLHHDPADLSVLDVGCGGGSLSFLFSRAGCDVVGVDIDEGTIQCARAYGEEIGSPARFQLADAVGLPFAAASFDVVVCSEVLEHVENLDQALSEIYRVLKFGGVLLFSTPNRTILSYLLLIKLAQDWRLTRVMKRVEHSYDCLVHKDQLRRRLETAGIDLYAIHGVSIPFRAIPAALRAYLRFKMGRGSLAELASALNLRVGGTTSLAYIGWGIKFG